MSTHEEAKNAMNGLTRTQIRRVFSISDRGDTYHCLEDMRSMFRGLLFSALKVIWTLVYRSTIIEIIS